MLSREGEVLAKPFRWPNSDIEFYSYYDRYGHGPTWHFLPSFYYVAGTSPITRDTFSQARVQAYSAEAKPIGLPAALVPRPGWAFIEDMAMNGDGTFVVVSQPCSSDFSSCSTGAQVFNMDGEPLVPFFTLGVPPQTAGGIVTEIARSGEFILFWGEPANGNDVQLFLLLFDRRGVPITGAIKVALGPPPGFDQPRVRRRGNDFVLSWAVGGEDGRYDFYLSEFSPSSRHVTPPRLIVHSYDLPQPVGSNNISADGYDFEMNDSGQGVVTWSTFDVSHKFVGHLRLITVESDSATQREVGER